VHFFADGIVCNELRLSLLELLVDNEQDPVPPRSRWERTTVDDAAAPQPSWGMRKSALNALSRTDAVMEVHTRLQKLYPNLRFFHMPAQHMSSPSGESVQNSLQQEVQEMGCTSAYCSSSSVSRQATALQLSSPARQEKSGGLAEGKAKRKRAKKGLERTRVRAESTTAECLQFVANAVVAGDSYQWHVDADPNDMPPDSLWVNQFGLYPNRVRLHHLATCCSCQGRLDRSMQWGIQSNTIMFPIQTCSIFWETAGACA
jgi:hypothetical protein